MVNDSLEVDMEQTDTFQLSVYKYTNLTVRTTQQTRVYEAVHKPYKFVKNCL